VIHPAVDLFQVSVVKVSSLAGSPLPNSPVTGLGCAVGCGPVATRYSLARNAACDLQMLTSEIWIRDSSERFTRLSQRYVSLVKVLLYG
jgi:hypothetical protein